ncbi:hypothetical protein OAS78_05580 [Pseudomonadales bacterium]|nr:hypothetical protein [Pseudomonadales bacterium]
MAISRRVFLSTGLLCVAGIWYFKGLPGRKGLPILSNNIESFFESYELNIPVEESTGLFGETEVLEKKLVSLLSTDGMEETIVAINKMIQNDYQMGKIRSMNSWIVSEVEFGLLILRNRYV